MDDESHRTLNQSPSLPWDRELHARLLDRLTADHARAVVFDVVFSGPSTNSAADEHLSKAIRDNGHVVLMADYVLSGPDLASGMALFPPYEPFLKAASGHSGFAQFTEDADYMIRQHYFGTPDTPCSSTAWVLASMLGAGATKKPENEYSHWWINYYGPPLTLRACSYYQALYPDGVPLGYFSNKVVYIGAHLLTVFAGERKDEFKNPYTADLHREPQFMPGVEVQATAFLNLLRGDWLTRSSGAVEAFVLAVTGLIFGLGLLCFRPLIALIVAAASAAAVVFVAQMSFNHGRIWFPWMIIVAAQIPIALLWSVVFNSVQLYVENRLYRQSLQMYLSPKLVKKFASEQNRDLLKPGAKKELLTVLFSDIASFTSISEGMDSDDLARLMNNYFQSAVSQCIHATDGTIVKYIGDAIFAFWNAPDAQIDHAMRGCEAALRFRDQPAQYINGRPLITRIGLHTGVANVGNFGSTARVDYTAIGENINLASRMEGLNKYLGTDVLITGATQAGIEGRLLTRFLGSFRLKGFEKAVAVYELVGQMDREESRRRLHEAFAGALKCIQQKDLAAAEAAFHRVLEIEPKDGPSLFYLKFIEEAHEHPLPAEWNGEVELKEK
jgi:adenylate cyclase